ncbi:MAG: carbohydrate ABC transporter substrate-binding protein [Oscillospiraceae bacterium]|nr:carbohydrate ABC transporter substrate-binding protein [Oscillospiraceae bacterium]
MKKTLALLLAAFMLIGILAACGGDEAEEAPGIKEVTNNDPYVAPSGPRGAGQTINLWSFTEELPNAVLRFKELNPDFQYEINVSIYSDQEGLYEDMLNQALSTGGANAPDIFVVEQGFVVNYSKFDFADFALPYQELFGSSLEGFLSNADIGNFIKEAGTNQYGHLVGLGYQSTGSAFIYRKDLAEQIWGAGDPATVYSKIGPGWDKFLEAAAEAKAEGISILSGEGDLWQAIRQSPSQWVVDGKLVIDDQRLSYLDIGYEFYNNNYTNKSAAWQEAWWADMSGTGLAPVLGYLGPAWLINYCMADGDNPGDTFGNWQICEPPVGFAWGGSWSIANAQGNEDVRAGVAEIIHWITLDTTDTGLQYNWANGTLYENFDDEGNLVAGTKDAVASGNVMARSDGSIAYLGGQNMFDIFVPAGVNGRASGWGPYDRAINEAFSDQATQYFSGAKTKDEAIAAFKQVVLDSLDIGS